MRLKQISIHFCILFIHTFLYFILSFIIYHISPHQYSIGDMAIYMFFYWLYSGIYCLFLKDWCFTSVSSVRCWYAYSIAVFSRTSAKAECDLSGLYGVFLYVELGDPPAKISWVQTKMLHHFCMTPNFPMTKKIPLPS